MERLYKIYPTKNKYISGILPNRKRIVEPTVVKNLNRQEFLRCVASGEVRAIINGVEIPVIRNSYEQTKNLFDEIYVEHESDNKDELVNELESDNKTLNDEEPVELVGSMEEEKVYTGYMSIISDEEVAEESADSGILSIGETLSENLPISEDNKESQSVQSNTITSVNKPNNSRNKHHGKHYNKNQR